MTSENHSFNKMPDSAESSPSDRRDDQGFNPGDYRQDLETTTLSDEEIEMLRALWHIMSVLVDIGCGVESVQLLLPELFGRARTQKSSLPPSPACGSSDSDTCDKDQRNGGEDE